MAVDLGSTTIAAHLCDLRTGEVVASSGLMNPQIRFGEDLMSRVSYAMMNSGGDQEMTRAVRDGMDALFTQISAEAEIDKSLIMDAVFVCNPVMHHLFLGIDPFELGQAPFALATSNALRLFAHQLDINIHPSARAYILPCIAGHVGADAAAVALSEAPNLSKIWYWSWMLGQMRKFCWATGKRCSPAPLPQARPSRGRRSVPASAPHRVPSKRLKLIRYRKSRVSGDRLRALV